MKKLNLKSQRGVTLVILLITIVILAILASVTIMHFDSGTDIRNYNYMCADIELLEDKILVYYNNNGTLPVKGAPITEAISIFGEQITSRDDTNYYQIDLQRLPNVTLNYGGGDVADQNIYVINERSHEVYYLKGTVYEGVRYYTPFN